MMHNEWRKGHFGPTAAARLMPRFSGAQTPVSGFNRDLPPVAPKRLRISRLHLRQQSLTCRVLDLACINLEFTYNTRNSCAELPTF